MIPPDPRALVAQAQESISESDAAGFSAPLQRKDRDLIVNLASALSTALDRIDALTASLYAIIGHPAIAHGSPAYELAMQAVSREIAPATPTNDARVREIEDEALVATARTVPWEYLGLPVPHA